MIAHVILAVVVALGSAFVFVVATLVVGALLVAGASKWFGDARVGRPVPEPRTPEARTLMPEMPHSSPVSAH